MKSCFGDKWHKSNKHRAGHQPPVYNAAPALFELICFRTADGTVMKEAFCDSLWIKREQHRTVKDKGDPLHYMIS